MHAVTNVLFNLNTARGVFCSQTHSRDPLPPSVESIRSRVLDILNKAQAEIEALVPEAKSIIDDFTTGSWRPLATEVAEVSPLMHCESLDDGENIILTPPEIVVVYNVDLTHHVEYNREILPEYTLNESSAIRLALKKAEETGAKQFTVRLPTSTRTPCNHRIQVDPKWKIRDIDGDGNDYDHTYRRTILDAMSLAVNWAEQYCLTEFVVNLGD